MRQEDDLTTVVRGLEIQLRDLKQPQFVGQDSILSYRTYSNDNYDLYFRIYQTSPTRYFKLTFTHQTAKSGALTSLHVFARADNSNVMANPIPYETSIAPALRVRWKKITPYSLDKSEWLIRVSKGQVGISYYDAYLKFYIDGTDSGSWAVQEVTV